MARKFKGKFEIFVEVELPDVVAESDVEWKVDYKARVLAKEMMWDKKIKFEILHVERIYDAENKWEA
jgi:hypothetical protein